MRAVGRKPVAKSRRQPTSVRSGIFGAKEPREVSRRPAARGSLGGLGSTNVIRIAPGAAPATAITTNDSTTPKPGKCNGNPGYDIAPYQSESRMADTSNSPGPGGFFKQQPLPSPAPSGSSTRPASGLPHPRSHPLRSGSAKEQTIRAYVDNQLMHIQRRFVKKSVVAKPGDDIVGYKTVGELCKDVEALLDIIWLSGTRKVISLHKAHKAHS